MTHTQNLMDFWAHCWCPELFGKRQRAAWNPLLIWWHNTRVPIRPPEVIVIHHSKANLSQVSKLGKKIDVRGNMPPQNTAVSQLEHGLWHSAPRLVRGEKIWKKAKREKEENFGIAGTLDLMMFLDFLCIAKKWGDYCTRWIRARLPDFRSQAILLLTLSISKLFKVAQ